jgi:hypothetical protein
MIGSNQILGAQCAQADGVANQQQTRAATIRVEVEIDARHSFASALLSATRHGQHITRAGWNAPGQWVAVQLPDPLSKMSAPYLYLKNAQGTMGPWVPSQGDMFANDWAILPN